MRWCWLSQGRSDAIGRAAGNYREYAAPYQAATNTAVRGRIGSMDEALGMLTYEPRRILVTYKVMSFPERSVVTNVTVPAAFVSVLETMELLPSKYSSFHFVVVYVPLLPITMKTVPTVVAAYVDHH